MNRTNTFLLFVVASLLWAACHADCVVSFTGDDNGNCTLTTPCATINNCLKQFPQGELTISLSTGAYNESNCGTSIDGVNFAGLTNVVVQALPNNTVSIDCQHTLPHFTFSSINATFNINAITLLRGSSATTNGGCISVSGVQSLTVQNVMFSGCNALNGGALYTDSPTSIMGATFTSNAASTGGGAIYINVAGLNTSTFTMSNSQLTLNTAILGGAIYISGDYATVTNTTITHNNASSEGGGLYLTTTRQGFVGNYNFLNSVISNNSADLGGGLYNENLNHTFNVFGAQFTYNTDSSGLTGDPNIFCALPNDTFCYSCTAKDCASGCGAGANQSCALNLQAKAFCYTTKSTTCSASSSCTCSSGSSGFPTSAKILIVAIAACMVLGIVLIAVDVIRHFTRKNQGYTPIS